MLVFGNSTISHSIDLDYANFNLDIGDKLHIEVVAERDMLIPCTTSMFIAEKVQYYDSIGLKSFFLHLATSFPQEYRYSFLH